MNTLLRSGRLGDVVLLGSITGSLGPCRVATEARYHEVAARLRGVVEVVEPSEARGPGVIDLQGSLRTRFRHPGVARIRKRSLRRRIRLHTGWLGRPTVPELYAEAAGTTVASLPWIDLPARARDTLVLVPGAAWEPKRPDPQALLAGGRAWPGRIVVLGGPGEEVLVARLAERLAAEPVVERGFLRTIDELARAALTIAGDTGLMHLAGACGSPVLALFGPTHPDDGFFVYPGEVLQRDLPCRPCSLHRVEHCRHGDHACRLGLAGRVAERVTRAYGEGGGVP